jgi:hypothetical protein
MILFFKTLKHKNMFLMSMTNTMTHAPNISNLKNDPSQTSNLHSKIQIQIVMLIELCVGNYANRDGLFNGTDGVFQYVTKLQNNEYLTWISFS